MVQIGIHVSYVCTSKYLGGGVWQIRVLLVWRGLGCEEWVPPYLGLRVGGIGLNYGGPLIGYKTTKVG